MTAQPQIISSDGPLAEGKALHDKLLKLPDATHWNGGRRKNDNVC